MILANICYFSYNIGFDPITLSIRLKEIERIKLIEISDHPIENDMRNEHYPK
jgi:hypothetical protein